MKCQECGTEEKEAEVVTISNYWTCGGRHLGHFEWTKVENDALPLCHDCESNQFIFCDNCGDLIDNNCIFGMEMFDDNHEYLGLKCPGCEKIIED